MLIETPTIGTRLTVAVVVWGKLRIAAAPFMVAEPDVVASTSTCARRYGVAASASSRLSAPRRMRDLGREGPDASTGDEFDAAGLTIFDRMRCARAAHRSVHPPTPLKLARTTLRPT